MIDKNAAFYTYPGILIGPIPYVKHTYGGFTTYAPDYSHPGVAERIAVEVDMIEDEAYDRRKL